MAIYYVIPDSGEDVGVTGAIAGLIGFIEGGYYGWVTHGTWAEIAGGAGGLAGGTVFAFFSIIANWLQSLAPSSTAMGAIAFVVKWLFGLAYGLCAGIGGFMGGTLTWFVWDISHHLAA